LKEYNENISQPFRPDGLSIYIDEDYEDDEPDAYDDIPLMFTN